jgi:hypothetical protein
MRGRKDTLPPCSITWFCDFDDCNRVKNGIMEFLKNIFRIYGLAGRFLCLYELLKKNSAIHNRL